MKQVAWIGTFGSSLRVEVICAPVESAIKAAAFDAVVLDSDTSLSTAEDASGRLMNFAGSAAAEQARALLPLGIGDVAVTFGGHLPVRHILHAVTVDHARNLFPTERTIRQTTRRILTRCEALQIRRLAMPAIGAELGRLDAVASTRSILAVLREHARFVTVLEHVFILVPDRAVFVSVLQHLQSGAAAPWRLDEPTTGEAEPAPPRPHPPFPEPPSHSVPFFGPEGMPAAADVPTHMLWGGIRDHIRGVLGKRQPTAAEQAPEVTPAPTTRSRPLLTQRYVLLEELGRGGFGIVHLAWDLVLRHVVAIKTLRPEFVSTEMFRQEAAIMIDFHHEAIVRAHHFEPRREEDGPYLVMEYVPWKTAEQWVADVGELLLPAAAVLDVGRQVCEALQYAHERSVLHLDIKPANIFVDSAAERAKLSDFGIAKLGSGGRRTALQQKPIGTPAYMAPEQMQVGAKLSPATDLYQLAVTLWDLLVGKPYEPSGTIPPIDSSRAHILELLQPALSNNPSQRPSDAQSFRNLLAFAASDV